MEILKGLPVANSINEQLIEDIKNIDGELPHLAIIRVGERPDDCSYERGAVKKMDKVGVRCTTYTFAADISNDEFQKEFDQINNNPDIDGILLLRPLPKHIDEKAVENRIDPRKDLDGISPVNLAKVYAGDETGYAPCTAEAVIEMLDYAGVDIKGKRVTVVGRSLVIGKPVAMLLMKRNATVTVVHTKTVDMAATCKHAEILVAAAGSAKMIKPEYVADGAVVIDVGINVDEEGKLCGDVDFEAIGNIASIATPVPGGVGSVTTSVLAKHLVKAASSRPHSMRIRTPSSSEPNGGSVSPGESCRIEFWICAGRSRALTWSLVTTCAPRPLATPSTSPQPLAAFIAVWNASARLPASASLTPLGKGSEICFSARTASRGSAVRTWRLSIR